MPNDRMSNAESGAWIDGVLVPLDGGVSAAAALIAASRQPLFAGLGTDIEGTRAVVFLAKQVGGVIDHMHSGPILRDLDSMRESGVMLTTPGEAHIRADTVLLVGEGLVETWPGLGPRILGRPARPDGTDVARRIVWLAPADDAALPGYALDRLAVGKGSKRAAALAALRARVKRRPVAEAPIPLFGIDAIAEFLRCARFGVAIWSAAALDAMEIEMLNGLVTDLNEATRFSTLPLVFPDNGAGVLAACGWTTGFPMRTGFGAGMPAHDPWRFDSDRLIAQGETDCVIWISAWGAAPPASWPAPAIALCDAATQFVREPKVRINVGRPGVDHDTVLHSPDSGSLVATPASDPSEAPSVARILGLLLGRVADAEQSA